MPCVSSDCRTGSVCLSGISKSFGANRVLFDVDFDLHAGEVHLLAGENGAGKSTLIKILGGIHQAGSGRIEIDGAVCRFRTPREAAVSGVAIIHQELSLVGAMSVMDNLMLGRERSTFGWLRSSGQAEIVRNALRLLALDVDIHRSVGSLPIGVQQLIEIAKALAAEARTIVMDEPTSALSEPEVDRLFQVVRDLTGRGCGIIYITHKLEEVYRIADRITVLRDGRRIVTAPASELPAADLVHAMVGRNLASLSDVAVRTAPEVGSTRLKVRDFSVASPDGSKNRPVVDSVSFEVRAGEIVGLGGLRGSGNSELLWGLFGAYGRRRVSGGVLVDGQVYRPRSPAHAVAHGLALVTNDRRRTGLITGMSISANATLASMQRISPAGWLVGSREVQQALDSARSLHLRAESIGQTVGTLSGGNQQKVVLAKWVNTHPRILLFDEPTRGVDVGAKHEIYDLMNRWSAAGYAIVLITSEMPELPAMADRIVVLHRGRSTAVFDRSQATAERIIHAAMGGG